MRNIEILKRARCNKLATGHPGRHAPENRLWLYMLYIHCLMSNTEMLKRVRCNNLATYHPGHSTGLPGLLAEAATKAPTYPAGGELLPGLLLGTATKAPR